jgi:hypothetical protein
MKLTSLNPRWVGIGDTGALIIGITFDSPTTQKRLGVLFTPPIDPEGWVPKIGNPLDHPGFFPDSKRWKRSGETFETLNLTPSLDFSGSGEWHGFITCGEVT